MSTARSNSGVDRSKLTSSASRSLWAGARNKALLLVVVVAVVVGGVMLILWVQDRPLRRATALLEQGLVDRRVSIEKGEPTDDRAIKDAYHLVSEYLESYPTASNAIALQARILVHMERPTEAIQLFEEVEAETPAELQDWARGYMMLGEFEKALPIIEQILRIEPNNEDALWEVSSCRMNLGLFQASLESAEAFAKIPGAEARGHLLLATLHAELENIPQSAAEFEKVLALEPDAENLRVAPAEVFATYGSTLQRLGKPAEALPALTRSLGLFRSPETYVAIGRAHTDLGDAEQADRALRQALELQPGHVEARELLAIAALDADDATRALELLTPLETEVDPEAAQYGASSVSSSTAFLLQQAYARLGNDAAAAKWQAHAEKVRKSESLIKIVNDVLRLAPASLWGRAIRAHHSVFSGDWPTADELVGVITPADRTAHPFLDKLSKAVEARDKNLLPTFDELPVDLYD